MVIFDYKVASWDFWLVIFFSLTEAPLPDPTPTPPNTPKRTRNRPETEPKRSQTEPNRAETEPNGAEMYRNQAFRGGTGRGFVGVGWVGGCKGKRKSLLLTKICPPSEAAAKNKSSLSFSILDLQLGHTPSTAGTFRKKFRKKTPERPRKPSQSVSWNSRREYGWDPPNPIYKKVFWSLESISKIISPQYGCTTKPCLLLRQLWLELWAIGKLRIGLKLSKSNCLNSLWASQPLKSFQMALSLKNDSLVDILDALEHRRASAVANWHEACTSLNVAETSLCVAGVAGTSLKRR